MKADYKEKRLTKGQKALLIGLLSEDIKEANEAADKLNKLKRLMKGESLESGDF